MNFLIQFFCKYFYRNLTEDTIYRFFESIPQEHFKNYIKIYLTNK